MGIPEVVDIDALHQDKAALKTLLPSTTSIISGLDGCYKKESTLKVVIPAPKSPRNRQQGDMSISADEARLLGESPKRDPNAIAIGKPGANQDNAHKRNHVIPRGFQPKNTLGQSLSAHQLTAPGSSSGFPISNGRKRNQLEIELSVGDNVKQVSQELGSRVPSIGEPHPKRKKLASPHNPAKYSDPLKSNGSDILRIRRPKYGSEDHACENHSQSLTFDRIKDCAKPQETNGSIIAKATYKTKGEKRGITETVILQSPDVSPMQVPTEIHNDGALPPISRPAYKETARIDPSVTFRLDSSARGISQIDSGKKSKYFLSDRGTERPSRKNQYRDDNGRRRTSDMRNLSSDELESGTTVGTHTVVNLASSDKRLRSANPAKNLALTLNSHLPRDNFGGLAPSTIPSTKFRKGANRRQQFINSPSLSAEVRQEKSESWGVELGCIVGTNSELIKGPDLGLDFNKKNEVYHVQLQGKKQGSNHQIDPKTIQKATISHDAKKMRFDFQPGKNISVQMLTEHDGFALLRHMQVIRPLIIEWKPCQWMDEAFDGRENGVTTESPSRGCNYEPLDVKMAKINKQRREDSQPTGTLPSERNPKRQRGRLLDGMRGEDCNHGRVNVEPEQRKIKDQINDITAANSKSVDQDPPWVNRFSQRIHQRTPNPHLSGSRAVLHRYAKQAEPLLTREETLPSLIHRKPADLGSPWKQPLLFPKDGKKKASVEFSDLERLEEAEFLNDNLIGFYLRYLEHRLEETKPEIAKKRGKRDINYEAVQNWTRSIDLFAFEYIVVPINESAHWYLAIICNLPAILPDVITDKSSAGTKDVRSLHAGQHIEDKSRGAAVPSDRPSSPADNVAYMEHVNSTVNKSAGEPDSDDQAPTASFAEMSLDTEPNKGSSVINSYATKSKSNYPKSGAEEQGLLDAQIKDDLAQATTPAQTSEMAPSMTEVPEQIQNDEGSVLSVNQIVHASAKKRKRKSVAPIKRMNPDSPAIITFDSLGLTHSPTIRTLKNYLHEEGKAKRGLEWDDASIKGVTAKDIPEQNNLCDCGLFLLGYVDKFLDNPKEFTSKILARQYDVLKDWPRLNPSTLRISIRKQIIDLHDEQQRDQREDVRKSDKLHGEESHAGKRGNSKDNAQAERGREEPQSPHQPPPSLRSSPKLEIISKRGAGKEEASETALGKDALIKRQPGEVQSISAPRGHLDSLQSAINPRKGLTRKEALELATEIGAPEPHFLINSLKDEYEKDFGFLEDNPRHQVQKPQLGGDLHAETSHDAAKDGYSKNEEAGQFDAFHRFSSSPSVASGEVADHAQEAVKMPSVIEDSQPDASQEEFERESAPSIARAAGCRTDEKTKEDFHRSPPIALIPEKRMPPEGRLSRPSKTPQQVKNSVIEID